MVLQISTTGSFTGREEKKRQLKDRPFVRLGEMKPQEGSVPKVLVHLDQLHVKSFLKDNSFASHPEILDEIIRGIVNSLNFDLIMTKNPAEQEKVKVLLDIFQSKRASQTNTY